VQLKGKNILITGGGKGIGFSTVIEALKEGAFVYTIVKSKKDLKKFENLSNLKIFVGNVTNEKLMAKVFKTSYKNNKPITGLVNNAGIRQRIKFGKLNRSNIRNIFDVNFFSVFNLMQIFSKYLVKKKLSGSIVNVGSIVGLTGFAELVGYSATKTALLGLTKSFAVEMAKNKIRANIISPGFTKTSYFKNFKRKKKLYNWTINKIPMKRWGNPDEISNLIIFLLSENSEYITGENIKIDGGWSE
jgi:3-oxoacyl-[acyl-carrier protein] reductase